MVDAEPGWLFDLRTLDSSQPRSGAARSAAIWANWSRAACRSSMISAARMAGSGRSLESPRLSSRSQKMSRLALSRLIKSFEGVAVVAFERDAVHFDEAGPIVVFGDGGLV